VAPSEFTVHPGHVAGFGHLASYSGEVTYDIANYVANTACDTSGYSGLLMDIVQPAIEEYGSLSQTRIAEDAALLSEAGNALNTSAYAYTGTDLANVDVLQESGPWGQAVFQEFPRTVHYPVDTDVGAWLVDPEKPEVDYDSLTESADVIGVIDWIVSEVTGWSPVAEITDWLIGDWGYLLRTAGGLETVGMAAEHVETNLTAHLGELGANWTGGAADRATDYVTRLAAAIGEEGPLNRTVSRVCELAAGVLEQAATFVMTALDYAARRIAEMLSSVWGFLSNVLNIKERVEEFISTFERGKELVTRAKATFEQAKATIEYAKYVTKPVREGYDRLEKLEEAFQYASDVKEGAELVAEAAPDIEDLAEGTEFTDRPQRDLYLGDHPRRPGA
jgi:hypothetical protein